MDFERIRRNFEQNGYQVRCFATGEAAARYLEEEIPGGTVGLGDSMTITALGLYERLSARCSVADPQHPAPGEDFLAAARRTLLTDVFLTSVNAAAATGQLVNIDGTGNRVAGSLFGHRKVYFLIGRNKITPTLEEAVRRARQTAAPQNAKRLHKHTPCAAAGERCFDCSAPERICNALVIHYKKMSQIEMEILLIDEDLGL